MNSRPGQGQARSAGTLTGVPEQVSVGRTCSDFYPVSIPKQTVTRERKGSQAYVNLVLPPKSIDEKENV